MAITFQSNTSTDGWARWPQQSQQPHANPDQYPFLETGMMSFECQSGSPTTPIQRTNFAQPFITNAFRHHQLSPPASPPYQGPVAYNEPVPLTPQTLPDSSSSFRAQPRPEPLTQPRRQDRWEVMTPVERSRSPSVTVEERRPSPDSSSASSPTSTTSKEITPNVRVGGAPVYETRTAVDDLMKVLQTRVKTAKLTEKSRKEQQQQANGSSEEGQKDSQQGAAAAGKARKKRFACDIPGCTKTFAQRNNLETHRRAHTGESPYVCPIPDCGKRFTQGVNLRSHVSRHLGQRPYECPRCGKAFPQRSNVKSHMKIHEPRVKLICRLDNCGKAFTVKGNLKTHQNRFHLETILSLKEKFASIEDFDALPEEEKEFIEYFMTLHNNANKGIKGRGKNRKVKRLQLDQPLTSSQIQAHQQTSQPPMLHQVLTTAALTPVTTPASSPIEGPSPHHHQSIPQPHPFSSPVAMVAPNSAAHHHGLPQIPTPIYHDPYGNEPRAEGYFVLPSQPHTVMGIPQTRHPGGEWPAPYGV